ncbi:hypothetical protein [Rhodoferax sp.]|uniref:hypothetical protein n=1 Tax=Rhodoferax sp. TaxID=50421 RepID=UPI0025F0681B|nr:hypothetical protein [Rhodoferax sp.]
MTGSSDGNPRERAVSLQAAVRRQTRPGEYRYTFVHDELEIDDPSLDTNGRFFVSPRDYGFVIRGFEEGRTAWARDFSNGTMLVVNAEARSHVLSPKMAARVLFIAPDGALLQDTGGAGRPAQPVPELATIRLTLTATVDLNGLSQEAARAELIRLVDRAVLAAQASQGDGVRVLEHAFDSASVVSSDTPGSSDTNFSQLLDM